MRANFSACLSAAARSGSIAPSSLPVSSKVGFLVLGPMMDFKLFAMYTRVFRPRLIWTIIVSVVVQTFIYSLIVHYVVESGFTISL